MVALVSTLIIAGFLIATAFAAVVTIMQYGHLIGPAWRMEEAAPRAIVVRARQHRQPVLARPAPPPRQFRPALRMAA